MTLSTTLLRNALPLTAALLAGLAFAACDLPSKDLGDDPPSDTEGPACQDGDSMMQDCNTCTCEDGTWACTEIGCDDTGADSGGMTCDPETKPVDECGVCQCQEGEWICPAIGCETTGGDECQDGDTMMQDCNTCTCEDGFWACTEIGCPEEPAVAICDGTEPADPVTINGAEITGDVLTLALEFGGGCAEHVFGTCWDGAFAESDPVQVWLNLSHEDNDDPCDGILLEDAVFDLTPLRDAWHASYGPGSGTITINVTDYGAIDYPF